MSVVETQTALLSLMQAWKGMDDNHPVGPLNDLIQSKEDMIGALRRHMTVFNDRITQDLFAMRLHDLALEQATANPERVTPTLLRYLATQLAFHYNSCAYGKHSLPLLTALSAIADRNPQALTQDHMQAVLETLCLREPARTDEYYPCDIDFDRLKSQTLECFTAIVSARHDLLSASFLHKFDKSMRALDRLCAMDLWDIGCPLGRTRDDIRYKLLGYAGLTEEDLANAPDKDGTLPDLDDRHDNKALWNLFCAPPRPSPEQREANYAVYKARFERQLNSL